MNYISFDEIIKRITHSIEFTDVQSQLDSLYKISRDVHNSRDYLGPCSSFILESISLLADMIMNKNCTYMRNEIKDTSDKICDIIIHMKLR